MAARRNRPRSRPRRPAAPQSPPAPSAPAPSASAPAPSASAPAPSASAPAPSAPAEVPAPASLASAASPARAAGPGARSEPPRKLTASGVDRGRSLAAFLADRLAIAAPDAEALVRRGSVYIGRRRTEDPTHLIAAGDQVSVHAAPPGRAIGRQPAARASAVALPVATWVIHRDREVIVVDKPAGVASQATRAASVGALDRMVTEALDHGARLLHRLDRDASGLVLFTRTAAAHRRFSDLLATARLERTYCAAVWGHWPKPEGALSGSIGRDAHDHRRMAVGPGRPALTRFRLIRHGSTPGGEPVSLLQLDLVTGRTHQIRVHLSHAGHPVCGDALYGEKHPPLDRLFLHAHRLAWPGATPVVAPVPEALSDLVG
jgi:RluA family pseudouridine synthase